MKKVILTLSLILAIACVFTACDQFPWQPTEKDDEITVEGGYLVVNGVKTEYEVNTEDVIEVVDGYLVVNGEKTEHKVYSEPVISVIDGYVAVNGVKTEYKVFADCEHTWETVTTEPTCTTEGYDTMTCLLCDKVVKTNMVEKLEHDYATTYMIDDNYHWYKCNYCAATSGKDLHTLDEEGVCTVCDLSVSSTPGVFYDLSDDKTYAMVVGYTGSATKVKIAEEYNGVPVKSIYDSAFSDCSGLTSVVIPDSVTSIGNSAFYGCSSLTSVVIPDSVTSIGINAFYGCHTSLYNEYEFSKYVGNENNPYFALVEITNKNMSTYTIHEDTKIIGGRVFSDCSRLSSITIPDSVTSISNYAFYNCSGLTSVVIPDSVTSIGYDAFANCSNLTSVVIGNSVTSIGNFAFVWCSSLTSVVIPDSVTSIGNYAFYECYNLTSVVISDSVTSIGDWAFGGCSNLTSVVIGDSVTTIGSAAFAVCSSLTDVYYTGSEEEWEKITIGSDNQELTDANIHYNYVPED